LTKALVRKKALNKIMIVANISQIKHTWFSFDFLFITDLSNYNAVIFTGKRRARMEGVQAFILSMKRESQIRKVPQKILEAYLVLSRDLRYDLEHQKH